MLRVEGALVQVPQEHGPHPSPCSPEESEEERGGAGEGQSWNLGGNLARKTRSTSVGVSMAGAALPAASTPEETGQDGVQALRRPTSP